MFGGHLCSGYTPPPSLGPWKLSRIPNTPTSSAFPNAGPHRTTLGVLAPHSSSSAGERSQQVGRGASPWSSPESSGQPGGLFPSRHPRRLSCASRGETWALQSILGLGDHPRPRTSQHLPALGRNPRRPRHSRVHAQQEVMQRGSDWDSSGRSSLFAAAPRLSPTARLYGQRPKPRANISRPPDRLPR